MPSYTNETILYQLDGSGPDGKIEVGKDDLLESTKTKLGDYVSKKQKDSHQRYYVEPGSFPVSIVGEEGNPAPITNTLNGSFDAHLTIDDAFGPNKNVRDAFVYFNASSNSEYLEKDGIPNQNVIKKGKSTSPGYDGNQILKDLPKPVLDKTVVSLKNNRFYPITEPGNEASESNMVDMSLSGEALGSVQTEFGKYNANSSFLKFEQLKKVGLNLMLRSSGEAFSKSDDPNFDPLSKITEATVSTVPGVARLGIKVNNNELRARESLKSLDQNYRNKVVNREYTVDTSTSYGSPYNYLSQFTNTPLATRTVAIALSAIIESSIAGVFFTLTAFMTTINKRATISEPVLGVGLGRQGLSQFDRLLFNYFGLRPTTNDYRVCVTKGLKQFFNASLVGVITTPGYYASLARNILRDVSDTGDILKRTITSIQTGPISDNITSAIDSIRSSKLISFIQILADMGDLIIDMESNGFNPNESDVNSYIKYSDIDSLNEQLTPAGQTSPIENPLIHIFKEKTSGGKADQKLAWSGFRTKSSYLMPQEVRRASTLLGIDGPNYNSVSSISEVKFGDAANKRISQDVVKRIEKELEAEYVPFYFHDLRTNEITSFHAFLENLTDGFDVEYEDSNGYGRIGKVLAYKNTNRKISFTFFIVSTSPADFDEMWVKINKLTTILHPQWSEGRTIRHQDRKFIQPFSQSPSASPLIRLRIGDVIKSNYSKFSLMRLFGLGGANFELSTTQRNEGTSGSIRSLEEIKREILARMEGGNYNNGESAGVKPNLSSTGRGRNRRTTFVGMEFPRSDGGFTLGAQRQIVNLNTNNPALGQSMHVVQERNTSVGSAIFRIQQQVPLNQVPFRTEPERANAERYNTKFYLGSFTRLDGRQTTAAGIYLIPSNYLYALPEEVERVGRLQQSIPPNTSGTPTLTNINSPDLIRQFFTPENNSIVKAYESTKGKGLAGVVSSMNFNWGEMLWETHSFNARAPKYVKVEVSFEPIHDINPGIDSSGFNRAPLYNVGNIMKSFGDDPSEDQTYFDQAYESLNRQPRR